MARRSKSDRRTRLYVLAASAWVGASVFWVQSNGFPLYQSIRPSWYVYGWPVCFATAGRGRFNFSSFSWRALAIDLLVSAVVLVLAMATAKRLAESGGRLAMVDLLAGLAGVASLLLIYFGSMAPFLNPADFLWPAPGSSEVAGDLRVYTRLPVLGVAGLWFGTFSIGYVLTIWMIRLVNRRRSVRISQ